MLASGVGRLGFVVYDPRDRYLAYSSYDAPEWLLGLMVYPGACIGQLEILAALLPYTTLAWARLRGRRVLHFIDNTSSMYSLFKGYSSQGDSSWFVSIFHLVCASLQVDVWWEYVRSKANIADLPSRASYGLLESLGAMWSAPILPSLDQFVAPLRDWLWDVKVRRAPRASPSARRAAKRARASEGS